SLMKAVANRKEAAAPPSQGGLRPDERVLLTALLGDPAVRSEVIDQLKAMQAIERLPSHRIFQAVFALDGSRGRISFDEVHARLEETDRRLLTDAVMRDDLESSPEEVQAAVESMRRSEQQEARVRLKARIKQAERAGAAAEALRLMAELQQLEKGAK